jgi:hypothetical protein
MVQVAVVCVPEAHPDHRYPRESPSGSLASARKDTAQGSTTSPTRRGWQPSSPVTCTLGGRFDGGEEEEVEEGATDVVDVVGRLEPVGGGAFSLQAQIRSRPSQTTRFLMGTW